MKTVPRVGRVGRVLDFAALLVFLAGGITYARSWMGLRDLPDLEPPVGAEPVSAVELAEGLQRSGQVGMALMLVGVLGFVAAWWFSRRLLAPATAPPPGPRSPPPSP